MKKFLHAEPHTKYRQAAAVYLVNAAYFFATFQNGAHEFGTWRTLLYTAGPVLVIVFSSLIWKEYRRVVIFLVCLYGMRTVVVLFVLPFITPLIIMGLVLHVLTCLMLARAAWNF